MRNNKLYQMKFKDIYLAYLNKITRKNKTKEELDLIICWLTGFTQSELESNINNENLTLEEFFLGIPSLNENSNKITGLICGIRVEEIENQLMKQISMLDKLVDELAKNKKIESIMRK